MLSNLNDFEIILASGSPRRRELLGGLGIDFRVARLNDVDESYPDDLPANEVAEYLSKKKAEAYRQSLTERQLIITADTVVITDGEILGKPTDAADATRMLKALSGAVHQVVTGVTVMTTAKTVSFSATTNVRFAPLSDEEIDYYISQYRPFDKAGAYGIQEWIGYIAVEGIEGSYFNVMGLPIQKLYTVLKSYNR
ncbi:MAG: Maf-like protein [Bacteroidales bacterium]|nr:Maf-like protein [Bacteroidales bacterium]MDD6621770.1 Maf-like protein [Bacteroidales bacterium]MDD6668089.1 Maf-like protein [Bacteroidales bacterium]